MIVAYVRVSTITQKDDRQVDLLQKYNIGKWYTEKVSAKDMNRPELLAMLDFVREGDTVYVESYSRLARNTQHLLEIVQTLEKKGVRLVSAKESLDTSTPTGKMMLTIIASIGTFERECLLERQREGIAIYKAKGGYKGRKPVCIKEFAYHYDRYMHRLVTKTQLAKDLHITVPTLNRLIKEHTASAGL